MIPARSIRINMTIAFSLSIAVLMAIVCSGLIWYARHTAERSTDRMLNVTAQNLKEECMHGKGSVDMKLLMEEKREDLSLDNTSVAVISPDSRIIGSSQRDPYASLLSKHKNWRTVRINIGKDVLIVGTQWAHVEDELRYHTIVLLVLSVFVTVLSAFGAWALVGRTLSPIALLSHQADTASTESLHVHLNAPSADAEITGLVATLNGLLARLAETAKSKGRFYSAASHELRTPLQALSGHLELALTRDRTNDEYKQVIEESYAQTRRLILLVRNLLLLYQLDSPISDTIRETGDLVSVCQQALPLYQPMIEERKLQIAVNMLKNAEYRSPPMHMEILVRNLVENAVKYADSGSEITINLYEYSGKIHLQIFNRCSSDQSWNADQIFEPFGRADSSRNSRTGGTGLGLAICKAITAANQWDLNLQQETNGVRATLIIPR